MIMNLDTYRAVHFGEIQKYYEKNNTKMNLYEVANYYSMFTFVPIIVTYCFLYEITKEEKLLENIESLRVFYKYSEIQNFNNPK